MRALFAEIDAVWPNRDRSTDGWIGDSRHCPGNSDHCADSAGRVHAIDIDKDGIDADLVVARASNVEGVIRYMNWNGYQYHVRNDFAPTPLTEADKHTTHIHVSIEHTDRARNYTGSFGIAYPVAGPDIVIPELQIQEQADWDSSPLVYDFGNILSDIGGSLGTFGTMIEQLRI